MSGGAGPALRPMLVRARRRRGAPLAGALAVAVVVCLGAGCGRGSPAGEAATSLADGEQPAGTAATTTLPIVPEAVPAGSTLVDERFDTGEPAGWAGTVGWLPVGFGDRAGWTAAGEAWSWFPGGQGWTDYAAHVEARIDAGALAIGLRAGPDGRYVVVAGTGAVTLVRDAPWGSATVVAGGDPLEAGRDHSLTVGVVDGHLQVWADGRLLLDHVDPDPLVMGTVTLGTPAGSVVAVDSVRVSGLGAGLPAVKPAGSPILPGAIPPPPDAAPVGGPLAAEPVEQQGMETAGGNDLSIGIVRFDQPRYRMGDPATVSVEVLLDGEGPVGPFVVRSEIGSASCESVVQSLSNFGSSVAACSIAGLTGTGITGWRVRVDAGGEVVEADEDDNVVSGALVVTEAGDTDPLPDLVVMWWATDPVWPPDPAAPVTIEARVGPVPPSAGEVGAYALTVSLDGSELCVIDVPVVEAVVSCPLETGIGSGRHVLAFVVDAGGAVDEGPGEFGNRYEVVIDL